MPLIAYLMKPLVAIPGEGTPDRWRGNRLVFGLPGRDILFETRPRGREFSRRGSTWWGCVIGRPGRPARDQLEARYHDYDYFASEGVEKLARLAAIYGGDYLAILVNLGTLVMVFLRAEVAGGKPSQGVKRVKFGGQVLAVPEPVYKTSPSRREISLRLRRPADGARNAADLDELVSWFEGSLLRPDLEALGEQFAAPEIDLARWLGAFGLGLPREREARPDAEAIYAALEAVVPAVLRGEPVDAGRRAVLEGCLKATGGRGKVPTTKGRAADLVALRLGEIVAAARAVAGPRVPARWSEIDRAVASFIRIMDGPAAERLVGDGRDVGGILSGAAVGRLLGHFDPSMARDPFFLIGLAEVAECWNAHGYVRPLYRLAADAHRAGFTLSVFPRDREKAFWTRFGILEEEVEGRVSTGRGAWSAEAVVDAGGSADGVRRLSAMFAREGADGLVLRCEADGTWRAIQFRGGRPQDPPDASLPGGAVDGPTLREAATRLHPRGVFAALDLPDLLAPGALAKTPARAGPPSPKDPESRIPPDLFRRAEAELADLPPPSRVARAGLLLRKAPEVVTRKGREFCPLRVVVPTADATYREGLARAVADQARRRFEIEPAYVVLRGRALWAVQVRLPVGEILRTLGDLPPGSTVAYVSRGKPFHFVIGPG